MPLKENCLTLYRKSNFSGSKNKQDVDVPMKIKNTSKKKTGYLHLEIEATIPFKHLLV